MVMDKKEIREARLAGVPESIIGRMAQGLKLTESEELFIHKFGKVYVMGHTRDGVWIRPHLRDLKGGSGILSQSSTNKNRLTNWFEDYGNLSELRKKYGWDITDSDDDYIEFSRVDDPFARVWIETDGEGNYFASSNQILSSKPHGLHKDEYYDDYEYPCTNALEFMRRFSEERDD